MNYQPEGSISQNTVFTRENLRHAQHTHTILESRALSFDAQKQLHFNLNGIPAIMPYEECADGVKEGKVRDIALITRVGHPCCFIVQEVPEDGPVILSRAAAQARCRAEYLNLLQLGDIISCRVTHIESFGVFCDIGCGISALLPIDSMSISRISSPSDRVKLGQTLRCIIKNRDTYGRIVLSMKELLGTWKENAALFQAGETVLGVVRSTESYGVFVELAPNLAGLAECSETLQKGQLVSVYIKSILPERMKIKLAILRTIQDTNFQFPLKTFIEGNHLSHWVYAQTPTGRMIETHFAQPELISCSQNIEQNISFV